MYRPIALILLLSLWLSAETTLSGSIGGMTLDSTGNPYLVTENITIPSGKALKINAGCVFLFKPFTGIIVEGSIEVSGTKDQPVIFTTENDSKYTLNTSRPASPFDWNGIHITEKADKARFSNALITYTVYGLKSQSEDISVENGVFFQNGQFHFTINDRILGVQDGFPFSYNVGDEKKTGKKRLNLDFIKENAPVIIGGTGLVSGVLAGVSAASWNSAKTDYGQTSVLAEQQEFETKGNRELAKTLVFGGISAAAIPTAIIMHLRKDKKPDIKSKVSVAPVFQSEATGVLVTLRF